MVHLAAPIQWDFPHVTSFTAVPGGNMGNDNNECDIIWEARSIGKGAFLHEVGQAFSTPHTTGIMARGYAQYWPRKLLSLARHTVLIQINPVPPYLTARPAMMLDGIGVMRYHFKVFLPSSLPPIQSYRVKQSSQSRMSKSPLKMARKSS
jgi:hypothetical protein